MAKLSKHLEDPGRLQQQHMRERQRQREKTHYPIQWSHSREVTTTTTTTTTILTCHFVISNWLTDIQSLQLITNYYMI
jgi:hypothetical protein